MGNSARVDAARGVRRAARRAAAVVGAGHDARRQPLAGPRRGAARRRSPGASRRSRWRCLAAVLLSLRLRHGSIVARRVVPRRPGADRGRAPRAGDPPGRRGRPGARPGGTPMPGPTCCCGPTCKRAVRVEITDPADPTPYWLVCTATRTSWPVPWPADADETDVVPGAGYRAGHGSWRRGPSRLWTVFSLLIALAAAGSRARRSRQSWKVATGKKPPENPPTPTSTPGGGRLGDRQRLSRSALARMLAQRKTAGYYASTDSLRTQGRPGVRRQARRQAEAQPAQVCSCDCVRRSLADHLLRVRELAAVVHQEAAHAGELVLLLGLHLDSELLVGQVRARQLERLGGLGLVLVDLAGVLVVAARLELLDALLGLVFLALARCVVVGRHRLHSPVTPWSRASSASDCRRRRADCAPSPGNAHTGPRRGTHEHR